METSRCPTCGDPLWGEPCPKCFHKQKQTAKNTLLQTSSATVKVTVWAIDKTQIGSILASSMKIFKDELDDYIYAVMACITTHQNDNGPTSAGDQYTMWEVGTVSVDYQGTRLGADGRTCWIDIQGQAGKSSSRYSLFQIMIQCGCGVPDEFILREAILFSLGSAHRAVLHNGGAARPKQG